MEDTLQGRDVYLAKACAEDWCAIWQNVWRHTETARWMLWRVTVTEAEAKERMRRTLAWQAGHDAWFIYERESGQAIGFAGVLEASPGVWEDTGIALGPAFTGRGYGKQVLGCLLAWCRQEKGAVKFLYTARRPNTAAHALARACGFTGTRAEQRTDPHTGEGYLIDIYEKLL